MTAIHHPLLQQYPFLREMYADAYFPQDLVDRLRLILQHVCQQIELRGPAALEAICSAAVQQINALIPEFEARDSELETGAREALAADFSFILQTYGMTAVDLDSLLAEREW